jgi:hypothetical protein
MIQGSITKVVLRDCVSSTSKKCLDQSGFIYICYLKEDILTYRR